MRSIFALPKNGLIFPHPLCADKSGLLAIMGDLTPERLLLAYHYGIFPWFNPGQVPMWYCPMPRFIVYPHKVKVHKSMRSSFNQKKFTVTYDTCFEQVMASCRDVPRDGHMGESWISDGFVNSYSKLFESGFATSVEVWNNGKLVGGLYGIKLGRIFFGESMFALEANASKFGFISLARKLENDGFLLIDCQQETEHLRSLGAELIEGELFMGMLRDNRLHFLST